MGYILDADTFFKDNKNYIESVERDDKRGISEQHNGEGFLTTTVFGTIT